MSLFFFEFFEKTVGIPKYQADDNKGGDQQKCIRKLPWRIYFHAPFL
jgi:hypothetical protein